MPRTVTRCRPARPLVLVVVSIAAIWGCADATAGLDHGTTTHQGREVLVLGPGLPCDDEGSCPAGFGMGGRAYTEIGGPVAEPELTEVYAVSLDRRRSDDGGSSVPHSIARAVEGLDPGLVVAVSHGNGWSLARSNAAPAAFLDHEPTQRRRFCELANPNDGLCRTP